MGKLVNALFEWRDSESALRNPPGWLLDWFGGGASKSGISVNADTAMRASAVFACVRVIAETVGCTPLILYERLEDGSKQRALTSRVYRVLHDAPNEWQTPAEFKEMMTGHAVLRGNAYALIITDPAGGVQELIPLHPDRMDVKVSRDKPAPYMYRYMDHNGNIQNYWPGEIFHLRGLSTDGIIGLYLTTLAKENIGLSLAAEEHASRTFSNGAWIRGVLKVPGSLKDSAFERLKKQFNDSYQGLSNANKTAILEGGTEWQSIGMTSRDAEFLELRKFQIADIARIFRVPPHLIGDLDKATFCLPGDSQIFTEHGPKSIRQVKPGDHVWSIDKDKKTILAKVLRSECTGEDEILEIKTRARTLRCNANHRVLVRREIYEPYVGGRGRSILIDGIKYRHSTKTEYVEAGNIREGDSLVSPLAFPDTGGDYCPTRKADVPFMESLGMILGDGFFARSHRNGKGSTFGISHSRDASYLPAYVNAIESSFLACDRAYGMKNGGTTALIAKRRDENTTVFYSTLAYEELERCGIVGTSKTKRVPEWVFSLNRELRLAFIRGYLDADGTVNKNGQIRFVSVNLAMLEQFRHLCMSCGIRVGNIFSSRIKSQFSGYEEYSHILYAFECSDPRKNAEIGTHTLLYRERINRKIADRKRRVVPIYPNEAQKTTRDLQFAYHRIYSITKVSSEPVYDLEVEGSHCFIANGVVVHNSNIEQQSLEFVTFTMLPWYKKWEEACNRDLFLEKVRSKFFVEALTDYFTKGDIKSRFEAYSVARNNSWMSVNEIRAKENLNSIGADGDVYIGPMNYVPLGDMGKQPATPQALPAPPPTAPKRDMEAIRALLLDAANRIVAKESFLLRKKAKKANEAELREFYLAGTQPIDEILKPILVVIGLNGNSFESIRLRHISTQLNEISSWYAETPRIIEKHLDDWANLLPEELTAEWLKYFEHE